MHRVYAGILALSGVYIPAEVYVWTVVFVLPVNSALNPLLYTISYIQWPVGVKDYIVLKNHYFQENKYKIGNKINTKCNYLWPVFTFENAARIGKAAYLL